MDIVERMRAMSLATTRDDLEALLDDAIAEIERLRSLSEPVRDGYVMVPREPTAEMHEAAFKQSLAAAEGDVMSSHFVEINTRIYRAMLSASPKQEDGK